MNQASEFLGKVKASNSFPEFMSAFNDFKKSKIDIKAEEISPTVVEVTIRFAIKQEDAE